MKHCKGGEQALSLGTSGTGNISEDKLWEDQLVIGLGEVKFENFCPCIPPPCGGTCNTHYMLEVQTPVLAYVVANSKYSAYK
jgi:hypothetical protein